MKVLKKEGILYLTKLSWTSCKFSSISLSRIVLFAWILFWIIWATMFPLTWICLLHSWPSLKSW